MRSRGRLLGGDDSRPRTRPRVDVVSYVILLARWPVALVPGAALSFTDSRGTKATAELEASAGLL